MSFIKYDPREIFSCGIYYSIFIGSTTLLTLYVTLWWIQKALMILYPFRYRVQVQGCHLLFRIILVTLVIIACLVPRNFYSNYNSKAAIFICNFSSSTHRSRVRLFSIIYAILFVSIPSSIICISALILLNNQWKHRQKVNNNLSADARSMNNRAIFIFFISFWLFLSSLRTSMIEIFVAYELVFYHDMHCSVRLKIYQNLLSCFFIFSSINCSVRFYIHIIMSVPFRQNFIQFITYKYQQNSSISTCKNNEINTEPMLPFNRKDKKNNEELIT